MSCAAGFLSSQPKHTMAKHTVYATKQTRYDGERVLAGTKLTVDESEMPQLMASGRFTENADLAPKLEKPKAEKADKADA